MSDTRAELVRTAREARERLAAFDADQKALAEANLERMSDERLAQLTPLSKINAGYVGPATAKELQEALVAERLAYKRLEAQMRKCDDECPPDIGMEADRDAWKRKAEWLAAELASMAYDITDDRGADHADYWLAAAEQAVSE